MTFSIGHLMTSENLVVFLEVDCFSTAAHTLYYSTSADGVTKNTPPGYSPKSFNPEVTVKSKYYLSVTHDFVINLKNEKRIFDESYNL